MPAGSVLSEGPLPDWQTAHFLTCLDVWWREEALISRSLLLLFFLAVPYSLWDLNSLTEIEPKLPEVEVRSPNHWMTKEAPSLAFIQ